jgi:hypothetical protein
MKEESFSTFPIFRGIETTCGFFFASKKKVSAPFRFLGGLKLPADDADCR